MTMKKILLATLVLCSFCMQGTAQETDITTIENVMYIDPIAAETGQVIALPVKMKNAVEAEGFQFNLTLPKGMAFVTEKNGEANPVVALSGQRGISVFNLFSSIRQNGSLSVVAGSVSGQAVAGNDGEVCTVMVHVTEDMAAGDYELVLKNIAISDSQARSYNTALVRCTISVTDQTGIRAMVDDEGGDSPIYNLQGQRLSNSKGANSQIQKGLYIRNGQKVLY